MNKLIESAGICHLPEAIIQQILLRLPIKSLCKFRAVCRSWNSIISTSSFIQSYSLVRTINSHNQHHQFLLIYSREAGERRFEDSITWICLNYDTPPFDKYTNHKLRDPFIAYNRQAPSPDNKINLKYSNLHVVGFCNGIVCLHAYHSSTFILWNPCIRMIVTLPRRLDRPYALEEHRRIYYGFGYDSVNNDYKVVRIEIGTKTSSVEICSLAQSSWKSLDVDNPFDNYIERYPEIFQPVFFRGALHWLHLEYTAYCMVSFDMSSELFGEPMILPEALRRVHVGIKRYRHSLAFIDTIANYPQLDIWVMKEYGVADSCTKLLTTEIPETRELRLLGFRNNGEAVISKYSREARLKKKLLNTMTNQVVGDFEPPNLGSYCYVEPFQESLALLDHPNAISS